MHRLARTFTLGGCNASLWAKVDSAGVRVILGTSRRDHIRSFGGSLALEEASNDVSKKKKLQRNERANVVENFVLKYLPLNQGKFPSASLVARETGGGRGMIKEILNELESRLKAEAAKNYVNLNLELDNKEFSTQEGMEIQATSTSAVIDSDQHQVTVTTIDDATDSANSMHKGVDTVTSSSESICEEKTVLKEQIPDSSNSKPSIWHRLQAITISSREQNRSQSSLEAHGKGPSSENIPRKGMSYRHHRIKGGLPPKTFPDGRHSVVERLNGGRRSSWGPLHAISAGQQSFVGDLSNTVNKAEGFQRALGKNVEKKGWNEKTVPETSESQSSHDLSSPPNSPKPFESKDHMKASFVGDLNGIPCDRGKSVIVENVPTASLSEVKQRLEKHGEILNSYYKGDELEATIIINYKTEEATERALAAHWVFLGHTPFVIKRTQFPRTTVVRVSNISNETDEDRIVDMCKSCGYFQKLEPRANGMVDVYFHPKELRNMIRILDRLNEVHTNSQKWQAQPAPRLAFGAGAEFCSSADGKKWIRSTQSRLVENLEATITGAIVDLEDLKELVSLQWHGRPSNSMENSLK